MLRLSVEERKLLDNIELALHHENHAAFRTTWTSSSLTHLHHDVYMELKSSNCPSSGLGAQQTSPAAINALTQDEALLSLFQRQERVQELMLEAQARLAQQDARVAAAGPTGNDATSLAQMTIQGPPATHRAPLVIGGAQPAEYIYVGLNRGQSVWAHAEIVAASVGDTGETGSTSGGQ